MVLRLFFIFLFFNNEKCYVLLKIFHFLQNKPSYDLCPSIYTVKFMFYHTANNYKSCFHWDVYVEWQAGYVILLLPSPQFTSMLSTLKRSGATGSVSE